MTAFTFVIDKHRVRFSNEVTIHKYRWSVSMQFKGATYEQIVYLMGPSNLDVYRALCKSYPTITYEAQLNAFRLALEMPPAATNEPKTITLILRPIYVVAI
jgi:hypothetical protein